MNLKTLFHCSNKYEFVGSRSVLDESLIEKSDFDFMAKIGDIDYAWLEKNGFVQSNIDSQYMDNGTVAVWKNTQERIDIVFKKDCDWDKLLVMWAVFKSSPKLFENYFWKSNPKNPIDQQLVKERINKFIDMLS